MIQIVGTLLILFGVLLSTEYLWKTKRLKGEASRKSVHIAVGTFAAFWPHYMSYRVIAGICLLAVGFIVFMRLSNLFRSVYAIKRRTIGDVIAPLAIGVIALLEPRVWVFTAAVLHIALADGLAALIGTHYGRSNQYKVFKATKSWAGSLAFFGVSLGIMLAGLMFGPAEFRVVSLAAVLLLPVLLTLVENVATYGTDNFFVPMTVTIVLSTL